MAENNQQRLLNGTPPQFASSDLNSLQSGCIQSTQANLMTSQSQEPTFSNVPQKRPGLMVNGQISSLNMRSTNIFQNTGPLSSSSTDVPGSKISNVTKTSTESVANTFLPVQTNMTSMQYPKMSYNSNSPGNHSTSVIHNTLSGAQSGKADLQTSAYSPPLFQSNTQSNVQFSQVQQPSPQLANKLKIMPLGNTQSQSLSDTQPVLHTLHQNQNQLGGRGNTVQQRQAASPYSNPPISTYGPQKPPPSELSNTGPPSYNSSPYNSRQNINLSSNNVTSSSSTVQDINSSPLHQVANQGSQASLTFASSAQSFPPYSNQPNQLGVQTNRWPSIPHGYQPEGLTVNHPVRYPTAANVNASAPTISQSGPHMPPTGYNQPTPNRTLSGPLPPPSSEVPPLVPPPRGPVPPMNQIPTLQTNHGNSKYPPVSALAQGMERMSVAKHGFNRLWGLETIDLLQSRNVLPPQKVTPPPIRLHQEFMDSVNCSPEILCCTMNKIPETNSLLQKSRLPLGILIHPFRDLNQLAIIQCSSIVRCRACRTYINPFVYFVDNKRWKCNLCFRINELPDEFQYDPVSKTYGDPSRRPEVRNSTIEFIAPSEYMLRPPQPAIYLFVLDISRSGCDSGYLETLCSILLDELDNLPGDCRTQIGFILFDSYVHFFSIAENYTQAHEMIVTDINDVFLPTPDSLLVNLNENKQLIKDLLQELPRKYAESFDTGSALGAALQAGYKLMAPTGGRITVFQSCLPNVGPGTLSSREDPNQRSAKDVRHLGPQTDFYKRLSLDCSTQQISVDLFLVSSQYSDLATIGGISQFSGGCIYYFPLFRKSDVDSNERLIRALRRYLTRKIGFEAVMRVRCSRGLAIHTFHGNFFVRSTDLLSLPNVNPDAGFGMQVAIEESLCELQTVCFQAAVLYTSAKGERRIRVHTLCLPVSSNLSEILTSADQQAIVGLLGKMAVDRSLKSSLSDAREAFINVAIDILSAYKLVETSGGSNSILAPVNLSLIPLYILALLKSTAFRTGQSTRLDDRVFAMSQMKTLPLRELIQLIHPDLYNVTELVDQTEIEFEGKPIAQPPRLSLSSEHLDSRGAFLLDTPDTIYLLIGRNIDRSFLRNIFDVSDISQIPSDMVELPELDTDDSEKLRDFINYLQSEKSWPAIVKVIVEPSIWLPFLINDKAENALSYYELLHHVKAQLK